MGKMRNNETGSAILIVLLLIVVALVGAAGWLVYNNHHKKPTTTVTQSSTTKTITPAAPANTYAGWKSFTLPKEKATFKYPSTWTLKDDNASIAHPPTDSENIELHAPDGFSMSIGVGPAGGYGGDDSAIIGSDPITFIGKSDYLLYKSYPTQASNGTSVSGLLETAQLSTSSTEKYKFAPAKNNITNAQSYSRKTEFNINMSFFNGAGIKLESVKTNVDLNDAKLIIKSVAY